MYFLFVYILEHEDYNVRSDRKKIIERLDFWCVI